MGDTVISHLRRLLLGRLGTSIECVLFDHADQLSDEHVGADALKELAHAYKRRTGWTVAGELEDLKNARRYMGRFSVPEWLFDRAPRWVHHAADWLGGVEPSPWRELAHRIRRAVGRTQ